MFRIQYASVNNLPASRFPQLFIQTMQTPTFEFTVNPLAPALGNCISLYVSQVCSGFLYATRCLGIVAGICFVTHNSAVSDAEDFRGLLNVMNGEYPKRNKDLPN
jgi:hypothetical protein